MESENSQEFFSISDQGIKKLADGIAAGTVGENWQWTVDIKTELPVRIRRAGYGSTLPMTLIEMFEKTKNKIPFKTALRVKRGGKWQSWNFTEFYNDSRAFACALMDFGINPHKAVNILGFNAPEWHIAFLGSLFGMFLPVGVYTTNGPEACQYIAEHSEAQVAVVENDEALQKYFQIWDSLPELRLIVVWSDKLPENIPHSRKSSVILFSELIKNGKANFNESSLLMRASQIKPGSCCTLVYTSGTTGNPKGVMLSHDNYSWTSECVNRTVEGKFGEERIVSYLPLSHVAAQNLDIIGCIALGAEISFAGPNALSGALVETLQDVRPTIFFGVPRVWEKIEEKLRSVGAQNGFIKQAIGNWAKGQGVEGTYKEINEQSIPMSFKIAKKLIFNNVKKALGLDQTRFFLYGAAPLSVQTRLYFASLNIFLINGYGMSECSGPQNFSDPRNLEAFNEFTMKSAGVKLDGTDIRIDSPDAEGNGEICYRGRNRFMGYFKDAKSTIETIDSEGYLHSGDVGKIDSKGNLYITGRIKELIITAGGENIPPILIENKIKESMPFISNVMIYGDNRKYLVCLISLKTKENSSELTQEVVNEFTNYGVIGLKTVEDAIASKPLSNLITKLLEKANSHATSRAQYVRFWKLLPTDFSIEGGELTPTMKLKRRVAATKWMSLIEEMYHHAKL